MVSNDYFRPTLAWAVFFASRRLAGEPAAPLTNLPYLTGIIRCWYGVPDHIT